MQKIKCKIGYAGKIHKSVRIISGNWYRLKNSTYTAQSEGYFHFFF